MGGSHSSPPAPLSLPCSPGSPPTTTRPRSRQVYERAIAALPPAPEKRLWQRYIYLWIKCAPHASPLSPSFA